MPPTISVSSPVTCINRDASPSGTSWPSAAPVRIARVVVVVTLIGRDVPRSA